MICERSCFCRKARLRCEGARRINLAHGQGRVVYRLRSGGSPSVARKRKSIVVKGWHVVSTYDEGEFAAKRELVKKGHECEMPMIRPLKWNQHGHRAVKPLFEGYIFVREDSDIASVKSTYGVSSVLMHCERPAVLADDELQFFLTVSVDDLGYYVDSVQRLHRVGDVCFPRSGRFAGLGGKLTELSPDGRTEMLFKMLGRNVKTRQYQVSELA